MKLPQDCRSLDDVYRWLQESLELEDSFLFQQLLRDRETEAAQLWIGLGRREFLVLLQVPTRN